MPSSGATFANFLPCAKLPIMSVLGFFPEMNSEKKALFLIFLFIITRMSSLLYLLQVSSFTMIVWVICLGRSDWFVSIITLEEPVGDSLFFGLTYVAR